MLILRREVEKMKYIILCALFFANYVFGGQYVMTKSVFSNGGGASSSATYILKDAVGQSVTGQSSSSSQIEQAGFFSYTQKKGVGVEENLVSMPKVFSFSAPYPNPVMNNLTINYGVPRTSYVSIVVYNTAGRVVKTLVSNQHKPGYYTLQWNRKEENRTPQGIYFIRLTAFGQVILTSEYKATKKVILLK